jgi:hypothetical protein
MVLVMEINVADFIQAMMSRTRAWRKRAVEEIQKTELADFSYRPESGMSSVGWLLAHQGAIYDFSLNVVILGGSPRKPELFSSYIPGTSGDWTGLPEDEIEEYYESGEKDLLAWVHNANDGDLNRIIGEEGVPLTFHGMRVIDFIANMFAHLNHHNGHLNAILNELRRKSE